jgi:hypothetical protein
VNEDKLLELSNIFDDILSSPSAAVQEAFQRLAFLATLSKETENATDGPFSSMYHTIMQLNQEVRELRRSVQILENQNNNTGTYSIDLGSDIINIGNITMLTGTPVYNTYTIPPLTTQDIKAITAFDLSSYDITNKP